MYILQNKSPEPFDTATQVTRSIKNKDYLPITTEQIKNQLEKLKNGKSPVLTLFELKCMDINKQKNVRNTN